MIGHPKSEQQHLEAYATPSTLHPCPQLLAMVSKLPGSTRTAGQGVRGKKKMFQDGGRVELDGSGPGGGEIGGVSPTTHNSDSQCIHNDCCHLFF